MFNRHSDPDDDLTTLYAKEVSWSKLQTLLLEERLDEAVAARMEPITSEILSCVFTIRQLGERVDALELELRNRLSPWETDNIDISVGNMANQITELQKRIQKMEQAE